MDIDVLLSELCKERKAVHPGHLNIQQQNIRPVAKYFLIGVLPVDCVIQQNKTVAFPIEAGP